MIVSRFPYPLEKGDKLRAYHQLKELNKVFDVTLVALHNDPITKDQKAVVSEICEKLITVKLRRFEQFIQLFLCLFDNRPFQTGYFYSWRAQKRINQLLNSGEYEHIYCQLIRTSQYVLNYHKIPKTLDYMDALSAGIKRRVSLQPYFKKWIFRSEARRLTKYERKVFDYFENHTIISEQDRRLISHPDRNRIKCIPNGIGESFFEDVEGSKTHDFVFVGNMSYPPNIEAVHYIVDKVLPAFPEAKLLVSGSSPHASIQKLTKGNDNITITGWVEDIRESYIAGEIFLAPMMIGTGMQNKLLEAMALGIPCVTTPLANNAIGAKNREEIMVGKSEEKLIHALRELRSDSELRASIGKAGANFVKENYSWTKATQTLKSLFGA